MADRNANKQNLTMKSSKTGGNLISTEKSNARLIESKSVKAVCISQFLSPDERNALYDALCKEQTVFKSYNPLLPDEEATKFLDLNSEVNSNIETNLIQNAQRKLSKSIVKQLPSLFLTLDIEPFDVSDIHLTFVNCPNGHYGSPHADSTNGSYDISILYYFNSTPKVFSGGDLEFFDDDNSSSNDQQSKEPVFTINFEDNLLIAFPSKTFHGVTKVQSDSTNFEDNRFIAVGFLSSIKNG